jgi:hypothetical protein
VAGIRHFARADSRCHVTAQTGVYRAEILVDAKAAGGEKVAKLAGVEPIAGFKPQNDRFFWLVGQGGLGIQLARMAACLLLRQCVPDDILAQGVAAADISPNRASLRNGSGL